MRRDTTMGDRDTAKATHTRNVRRRLQAFREIMIVATLAAAIGVIATLSGCDAWSFQKGRSQQQTTATATARATMTRTRTRTRPNPFRKKRGARISFPGAVVQTTRTSTARSATSTDSDSGNSSSSNSSSSNNTTNNNKKKTSDRSRRNGMAIALVLANFSVMGAKCALPSVMAALLVPGKGLSFSSSITGATPQQRFARLLGCSTLAVALGKLLLGPVIDAVGGIVALESALGLLAALLATIATHDSFAVFAACWILVDFVFSSCWAACISAIQQSFPSGEWGTQIGNLATGARLGNAVSFGLFATILYRVERLSDTIQPWRVVFGVSALLQVIPLGLLLHYGGKTLEGGKQRGPAPAPGPARGLWLSTKSKSKPAPTTEARTAQPKPRWKESIAILKREATTPEFWLHGLARSCLMVFASFLLFVPTLMARVYGCSGAVAAQVAAAYSLGCLSAVVAGSGFYSGLPSARSKIAALVGLLALAASASGLQLAHVSSLLSLSPAFATATMVVWGFAFAVPFYLPSSLYALARGGREGSASIADGFDVVGFGLLAGFNEFVASISGTDPAEWIGCFAITTACALVAMVAQSLAVALEAGRSGSSSTDTTE